MNRYQRRGRKQKQFLILILILIILGIILWAITAVHSPRVDEPVHNAPARATNVMYLTVPAMKRVDHLEVKTGWMTNEKYLHDSALHVRGTGLPWEDNKNVYIAGHRLGFPGTDSWLVFWDLNVLKNGDVIYLQDDAGHKWTYKVFRRIVVSPSHREVLKPIDGLDTVSLQTCTLPDYADRFIVVGKRT